MNSFILVSSDITQQHQFLDRFYIEHAISIFDRTILNEEGSIGIALIRELQEKLYLSPYQGKTKSIVIFHAQHLTLEAQNALLKLLEEPPAFVCSILIVPSIEQLLPTIVSRCQMIQLPGKESQEGALENIEQTITVCFTGTIGEKLSLAEKISTDKDHFAGYIEQMMKTVRNQLLEEQTHAVHYIPLLMRLQKSYDISQTTNVNIRLLAEHMLLSL